MKKVVEKNGIKFVVNVYLNAKNERGSFDSMNKKSEHLFVIRKEDADKTEKEILEEIQRSVNSRRSLKIDDKVYGYYSFVDSKHDLKSEVENFIKTRLDQYEKDNPHLSANEIVLQEIGFE